MLRIQNVRATGVLVSLSLLVTGSGVSQSPPGGEVRFKVQSDTVVVDVIVTDSKGNIVPGLTANDFKLTEDGVPQKIVGFEAPSGIAPKSAPVASSTGTAASSAAGSRGARLHLVTLVIDLGDTQAFGLAASIKAASEYVQKTITADDYVAVYALGTNLRLVVPYTTNKARLVDGIQSIGRMGNQGIYTARDRDRTMTEMAKLQSDVAGFRSANDLSSRVLADMANMERLAMMTEMSLQNSFQARQVFIALRSIAIAAGTLPGRKNVILFSEGFLHSDDAEGAAAAVVSAANRSNVAFYVVDPSGNSTGRNNTAGGTNAENSLNTASAGAGLGSRTPNSASSRQAELARMGPQVVSGQTKFDMAKTNMALESQASDMADLASATGGFVVKSNSALYSLERIDRDMREHFTLTYQPANTEFDGKLRKIKVDVEGRGYRARYRKGYWALAPGDEIRLTPAAAQMVASVTSGSLKPTVNSKLNAALVFDMRQEHAVPFSVWLPNETSWASKDPNGGYSSGITLVVTARDAQGHLVDAYQKFVDFQATKDQWKDYEKRGLQLMASLSVPNLEPLDVQAIVQFSNGKSGLASAKVAIPGAADSGVRPTSLLLTSHIEMAKKGSEGVIPALRIAEYDVILPKDSQFLGSGKLTLYFGLADVSIDAASGRPLIGLAVTIKDGTKVIRELPALDGLYPWPQSKTRLFFLKQFDLAGLAPGTYTVETTVRDRAKNTALVQTAPFSIQ